MRPYLSTHPFPFAALRYARGAKDCVRRPAVPILPEPAALKLLEALRQTGEGQGEVLTVTLSLPRGRTLNRAGWRGAIGVLWDALGLPGEAMPWEAWRHDDTPISYIHSLARSIVP